MKNQAIVEALRRQVDSERVASKRSRVRFSLELKRRVVALIEDPEWGPTRVSRTLGLAQSVVQRWSKHSRTGTLREVVTGRARPLEMARMEVVALENAETKTFELEFPSGAKVVGLTRDDLVSLLGGVR